MGASRFEYHSRLFKTKKRTKNNSLATAHPAKQQQQKRHGWCENVAFAVVVVSCAPSTRSLPAYVRCYTCPARNPLLTTIRPMVEPPCPRRAVDPCDHPLAAMVEVRSGPPVATRQCTSGSITALCSAAPAGTYD